MASSLIERLFSSLAKGFIYLWTVFILAILVWIILASLKTNQELFANIWTLPSSFQWGNYHTAWINSNLSGAFVNSVIVVLLSVIGIVLLSTPAAYVLSRIPFKGRGLLTNSFIIGIGIPHQAILIPLYLLLLQMHLINTLTGLILVNIAAALPFTIFILTGFFSTIPVDVEEAAALDGASPNKSFWTVILPMAQPGIITVVILNSVSLWNEFLFAYAFINSGDKYTLSVGIYKFFETMQYNSDWVSLFAGVVIVILPILSFYLWLSDRIIGGMTMGSGK